MAAFFPTDRQQILHFVYCLKPYQSSNNLKQSDGHQNLNFNCLSWLEGISFFFSEKSRYFSWLDKVSGGKLITLPPPPPPSSSCQLPCKQRFLSGQSFSVYKVICVLNKPTARNARRIARKKPLLEGYLSVGNMMEILGKK